jgi:hypothetical protein
MASGLGGLTAGLNPVKKRKPLYLPGIEGQFLGRPNHNQVNVCVERQQETNNRKHKMVKRKATKYC